MYRSINDFIREWRQESELTSRVLHALSDESLQQPVAPGLRTLGRIAWHITCSIKENMTPAQLDFTAPLSTTEVPAVASKLAQFYDQASRSFTEAVEQQWTDATLGEERDFYGQNKTVADILNLHVHHEIHHRGQLLILMRQAGIAVPDVYGPTFEQWKTFNMEPPAV